MNSTLRTRIGPLLAELLVVFLGVLIALAADSWWESRSEARLEHTYLLALQADLAAASRELDRVEQELEVETDWTRRFNEWLYTDESWPSDEKIPDLNAPKLRLPTGTLDALLSTGDVNLLSDPALRGTIIRETAAIRAEVAEYNDYNTLALSVVRDVFIPINELRIQGAIDELVPPPDHVRSDARLSSAYTTFLVVVLNQSEILDRLSASIDALVSALEAALAAR